MQTIQFPFYFSAPRFSDLLNLREALRQLTGNNAINYEEVDCMKEKIPHHSVGVGLLQLARFFEEPTNLEESTNDGEG